MILRPVRIINWMDEHLPQGTPGRKVVEVVSIILLVEGLSVLVLFSYVSMLLGFVSLILGTSLLLILRGGREVASSEVNTPGVIFVDRVFRLVGGDYAMMLLGSLIIVTVLIYNVLYSPRPDLGDSDTMSIIFGSMVMLYPLVRHRYRLEAAFSLIFLGCVWLFLVFPQMVMSLFGGEGDSALGNWYVHYMLAAPFAGILDLLGISSSSIGNLVTIQFQDGSFHTLSISAYCAGLYSFSIFLSAFIAFVLAFERLPYRILGVVLAIGVLVAYLGNLLRMVIIGVVGYYRGIEALHWAHENVGWMIFLAWSVAFWWLILSFISRRNPDHLTEGN